ncbi:MAG: HEAT repeat domain-containing protein [Planctomycetia bacterium]|nr:HEAT repeat domain-containing protein [Planctomycetia bacterium]
MSQPLEPESPALPPDRGLPPVEPPSARFIVQLFVVPAVIVIIIVAVWLVFNWVAQMGADPTKYVQALRRNNEARWQAAASLADLLNDPRYPELKQDRSLARELGALLTDELKNPGGGKEQTMLEVFLCRALGEFEVAEAAPPLLTAASVKSSDRIAVRRAALEGLAVLASHLPRDGSLPPSAITGVLAAAADDTEAPIRSAAAFALGVVGDRQAAEQLERLLHDTDPDVRYNAATGLGRRGDPAAIDVIVEMLDPESLDSVVRRLEATEPDADPASRESARAFKKALVVTSGLQAVLQIAHTHPELDIEPLRKAVERLTADDQPSDIRSPAKDTLRRLEGVRSKPSA